MCSLQNHDSYKTLGTINASAQQQSSVNSHNNTDKSQNNNNVSSSSGSSAQGQIEVQDVFKPHGNPVHIFFEATKQSKDELYTPAEMRNIVMGYIKDNNLASPRNQK